MGFYRLQSEGFELRSPDEQVSYRAALKKALTYLQWCILCSTLDRSVGKM